MLNFNSINEIYDFLSKATLKEEVSSFLYNEKNYDFSLVSSLNISSFDKKVLTSESRLDYAMIRTLKLFFNPNITAIEIQCVSSSFSPFYLVINYVENKKNKTLDYSTNVIMDMEDYYKLFNVKTLNALTKSDLYKINELLLESEDFNPPNFLLLTTEEINEYIKKEKKLKGLSIKYGINGVNTNSYFLFDDSLFCLKEDFDVYKEQVHDEIEYFTSDCNESCNNIYHLDTPGKYIYSNGLMKYEFSLISDQIPYEGFKKLLLSYESRYNLCHNNFIRLASVLKSLNIGPILVVAGKRKSNDVDYLYHTWLEIDDLVYDFNGNLIMKREDYYELYQAAVLAKTPFEKIIETGLMCNELDIFKNESSFVNFFCDELSRDLKKNKFLFKN